MGVEVLDEVVGNLKVQLVPKTNFWSNAAGAWNVVKAVTDLLKPTPKTTILEIGCGIGVIGLSIASVSTCVIHKYVRKLNELITNQDGCVTIISHIVRMYTNMRLSNLTERLIDLHCNRNVEK